MLKKLKLNVGSAVISLDGYINIDLYCPEADEKMDARYRMPYKENSVDEILASHLLEHFSYRELPKVLENFYRILKDDGILHIRVPNLLEYLEDVQKAEDKNLWPQNYKRSPFIDRIYGGQWNEGEFHKNGFTPKRLIVIMGKAGFDVKEILPPRMQDDKTIKEINIIFKKRTDMRKE